MAYLVGRQMGSYRLTRLLGRGGFAEVYLGDHLYVPGTQAAIKVLGEQYTDDELQRFCKEVGIIFRLVHPLIVRVLDFGVEGRTPYLVMDYAPNGTLRQRHQEGTRVPLATILSYLEQVARALQFAHDARVVHRDIKPENLLVSARGQVLLSDFGIAVRSHRSVSQTPQKISGTARYMAPEQCTGKACEASDQYALAVMVYEWLSGEPPFPGDDPFSVALQQIQTPPPPLRAKVPRLSLQVEQVVLKALAKDPKARFPSVHAFAAALQGANQAKAPPGVVFGRAPASRQAATRRFPVLPWPEPAPASPPVIPHPPPSAQAPLGSKDLPSPDPLAEKLTLPDPPPAAQSSAKPPLSNLAPPTPPTPPVHLPAQQARQTETRQDHSILGQDSIPYAISGLGLALIGVIAAALGHWEVGGPAIIIGIIIFIAVSLFF